MNDSEFQNEARPDTGETARKPHILAVDDAPVMQDIISSTLSDDYDVFVLSNPKLVEKYLQQMKPDLILLDYKMPGLTGFDLVPIIRKFEAHKDTPIIFLTSMGTSEHILTATNLGASDFIVKPFKPDVLREKVAKYLAQKKPLILAVDKTPVMLKTISSALGGDYEVFTLSDPMLVEKYLQEMKPDLVLLDYNMPGVNMSYLLSIIKKFKEHKNTPIIFLTSVETDDILGAVGLGASDFIVKPFKADTLREKVAKYTTRKKL